MSRKYGTGTAAFAEGCLGDRQCALPVAYCGRCRGEVYREDIVYTWEGGYVCAVCMEELFDVMTTGEKAEALGARPVPASGLSGAALPQPDT